MKLRVHFWLELCSTLIELDSEIVNILRIPHLTQLLANLLEEGDGHLGAVVRGVLQQQGEDLQGQDLVRHLHRTHKIRHIH